MSARPTTTTNTLGGALQSLHSGAPLELDAAVAYFGPGRTLESILPGDVRQWLNTLSGAQDRECHRTALATLYQRAQERGTVPVGFDPSSVFQHLACPGDQVGITDFVRTYRARQAAGVPQA